MRVQLEIMLGLLLTLVATSIMLFAGFNEEQRMQQWAVESNAESIEIGAALYAEACASCHGPQGKGVPGLCPPLNDRAFFTTRMQEVGWSGTMKDFIVSTVAAGRLASTRPDQYVGNGRPAMPSWSQDYGGPYRVDQVENIADYIMNWETEALAAPEGPVQVVQGVGTDITVSLPAGDAARGEATAAALGCAACHISTAAGPAWLPGAEPGIGERAAQRFQAADYTGNAASAEQYLLESIVLPNAYIVSGFAAGVMPQTYGDTVTAEQTADMIAYLLSLK
jgi:mono/diheme cytochrome c family protein